MQSSQGGAALEPGAQSAELWLRISVTLAALIAYRAGCQLPIPGLNGAALATLFAHADSNTAIERISIFALGVLPLLSVLLLTELGKLVFAGFRVWADANGPRFNRMTRLAALGLSALQALGIAVALEDVATLVAEPGFAFRAGTVITLVAGTAFLIWLADAVTRYGVGSGFWLLLAMPGIMELPSMTASLLYLVDNGSVPPLAVALVAGCIVLSTAVFVALAKANGGAEFPRGSVGPWPPLLGYASLGWLLAASMAVPSQEWRDGVLSVAGLGRPVSIMLHAFLVGLFALLYANPSRERGRGAMGLGVVAALALVAITLVPELLASYFNLSDIIDGRWLVIIVTVALGILSVFSNERRRDQSAGAPR